MNFMPKLFGGDDGEGETGPTKHSPYVDSRREWNERYGSYVAQRDNWRRIAFGALGLAAFAMGGWGWQASQSKVVPYVVAVDKLGDAIAVGPAERAPKDNPRAVRAQLARWIVNVRTVTTDMDAATRNVEEAYAATDKNGPALQVLNEWYAGHDPYRRARDAVVVPTVSYVRFRAGHTWIVGWREEERPHSGPALPVQDWEMEVVVATDPPMDEAGIRANATGNYVTSFNWGMKQ